MRLFDPRLAFFGGTFLAASCTIAASGNEQAARYACQSMPIAESLPALREAKLIAIGEPHGNDQSLGFLKCVIDQGQGPILLAYELPAEAACRFSSKQESDCRSVWNDEPFDGRTSRAADQFLRWASDQPEITLVYFDPDLSGMVGASQTEIIDHREELSAERIVQQKQAHAFKRVIVFTGSLRASRDPYTIVSDTPIDTLMMRLENKMGVHGTGVVIANKSQSEVWQCRKECGVQPLWPNSDYYKEEAAKGVYDYVVDFDELTPSFPAGQ